MEGSRHERAAIVIASYVIGFITAFILLGNTGEIEQVETFINLPNSNAAAVVSAKLPQAEVSVPATNQLNYTDGRLEMTLSDGIHLLSFNPEVSGLEVNEAVAKQGFHYGEIQYQLSDDSKYVFFCEQQAKDSSTCLGYVYQVDSDRIYPVTRDGVQVQVSQESARAAIWDNGTLLIGKNSSANTSMPWALISEESQLDLQ